MHILFIGYGKTSKRIAKQLFAQGHQITAISTTNKTDTEICHLQQDVKALDLNGLKPIDLAYVLLSPKESSIEGYRQTYVDTVAPIVKALQMHPIKRIFIVSSTRVYGADEGQEVNDLTHLQPNDEQGKLLQKMEQLYQSAYPKEAIIVRPSGIYGESVARMIALANKTTSYSKCHWSNRIHIDDLASFLVFLATKECVESSYIVSNSKPYPLHEVIQWFQKQLNLPLLKYEPNHVSGKKIYATALQASGFKLSHQDFFQDYEHLLKK